jgi:hypothetical protein
MINKLSNLYGKELLCCEMCDKWTPDWISVEDSEGVACESCAFDQCRIEEAGDERFFYMYK